jgi:protein-disulfide isomerase
MPTWTAGPRRTLAIVFAALALLLPGAAVHADDALDEARIEKILTKLLQEKPDLVIDAIRAYQAREEQAKIDEQRKQVTAQKNAIHGNPKDPYVGNPDAKYTVVEFFDYRCGYCKRSLKTVLDLVERNKDVKVVFKEFPILGEDSIAATRVSLAVQHVAPQHYRAFHTEALHFRGTLNLDSAKKIAVDLGVNKDVLENAMKDDAIKAAIQANYDLAEALNIRGTPAFVIGDEVVPGAISLESLEALIAKLRS